MQLNTHTVLAFTAIMGTIGAGMFHWTWWVVVAGACSLALVSLTSSFGSFARYGHPGSAIAVPTLLFSSALNASAAACASYLLGRSIGWFWGI